MIHAFNDATSIPHGYLLVDLKPFFKTGLQNQINKDLLSIFQEYKKGVFEIKSIICVKMAQ